MKLKTYLLLSLILISGINFAQKPQAVYSIVKQMKSYEWYVDQAGLWKEEINKDSTNAEAWYNYYIANRMANLTGKPDKWKTQKHVILEDLSEIVDKMEKLIPESFEFNNAKWWNGGNNFDLFPYLEKAYKINPSRSETYDEFITYYEVNRQTDMVEKFCKLWYESGDVSPGILNWNYNTLMSVDDNAIIFTNGDNDTYPKWILQYALDVRKDIIILNTSLLFIDNYSKAIIKELKMPAFNKKVDDFYTDEIKNSGNYQQAYNNYQQALIKHIIDNSESKPVYFGSSLNKNLYGSYEDNLYIEGLAFKYSEESYDNIAVLSRNYEKRFLLDYLLIDLNNDISKSVVNHTNMNYIMAFIRLYEHYNLSGEFEKAKNIKELAQVISKAREDKGLIMRQFE